MGSAKAIMAAGWAPDGLFSACPWAAWPLTWDTTTNGEGSVLCKGLRKNK